MASLITEFNHRLNKEIKAQTENIASNVVKLVEHKLCTNVERYVQPDLDICSTGNIMADGSGTTPSTRYNQAPQDVCVVDAQAQLLSASPTSEPEKNGTTSARVTFASTHNSSTFYEHTQPPTTTPATNSTRHEGGLCHHHDGNHHVFTMNSGQLRDDPNITLARNEDDQIEAFLDAKDAPHCRNMS